MDSVQRIIELMQKHNLTAKQFTSEAGLSSSAITEWKKGKSKPSAKNLEKISNYFGVSVDYLLHGEAEAPKESSSSADNAEEDDDLGDFSFALSGDVHELSPEEVASVKAFIRLLKQQKKPGNDNHGKDTWGTKLQ